MKFTAAVIPSGNATGVEVPADVHAALGPEARPAVAITINGHTWRSRIALMRGQCLVGISAANRAAARIAEGDVVEVVLERDEAPRDVAEPPDLAAAFDAAPGAREAFHRLPFGLRRKHIASLDEAKSADTRRRRIEKLAASLS